VLFVITNQIEGENLNITGFEQISLSDTFLAVNSLDYRQIGILGIFVTMYVSAILP